MVSTLLLSAAPVARAEDSSVTSKRLKVVAKSALFGFGGGLVVGIASQAFKKRPKNIFMFGSLGMYAGILLGIYVVSTSSGPAPYEGPDTYEDYSSQRTTAPELFLARAERSLDAPDLRVNFLNIEF